MTTQHLRVTEFTKTPGPRYRDDGPHSGEWFREEHLRPAVEHALQNGGAVIVDLDGAAGYATSFLEEAFGGLVRSLHGRDVRSVLTITCTDEPELLEEIDMYMDEARNWSPPR